MTEKRFIVIDVPYENGEPFLYKKMLDKTTKKEYDNTLKGIDDMCDLSNKLHEENEVLKQRLKIYKNDGLETLRDLERAYENNKKALNNIERLEEENKQLQQELFESEYENICERYRDNPIRRESWVEDLKEEFKERFGRDFE